MSGVGKERMTTMNIAIFVTLTLNLAMQEKHNYYNMLLNKHKEAIKLYKDSKQRKLYFPVN